MRAGLGVLVGLLLMAKGAGAATLIPDGRVITPTGFTVPVEGFAAEQVLSPDGKFLAVLSQDGGAVDVISTARSVLSERLAVAGANGMTWTVDGLYVTRGYAGSIARFRYDAQASRRLPMFTKAAELAVDGGGLLTGIAQDPATKRIAVARTADRQVLVIDEASGGVVERFATSGQPYSVAFSGDAVVASLYDSDHIDLFRAASADAVHIPTGAHPTQLLVADSRVFVANADGHDVVAIDPSAARVVARYDLAAVPNAPPGQTPAGMSLSPDGALLYVAESGYNDVAVVDLARARVIGRIPTAWYPTGVTAVAAPAPAKGGAAHTQLWIASAKGLGSQPDPAGEWNGTYTGLVQHLVYRSESLREWTRTVARNDRFDLRAARRDALPPIKHVVFIVRENKHFDEEFADIPNTNADPTLLLFGRAYTPNAHALAQAYTTFDNLMSDGEASIYGHAWTTQSMTNDYHERNAHIPEREGSVDTTARVAYSIWPYPIAGEATATQSEMDFDWYHNLADLPRGPRINVAPVFGPRGQLVDELMRKRVSFRVYGEQLTMQADGTIVPGLADHAMREYPGSHINFNVLDDHRAALFLKDVAQHGLAAYSYLTLPTDHTAGLRAGFYTPQSYIASNDAALGTIVSGLSRRADWRDTIVIVTCDDAQGTGDHVDDHRMPALAVGPYIRRGFVSHTRYSQVSILRTVEALFGLDPLTIYDAAANPMADIFATQPQSVAFTALPMRAPLERNPGTPSSVSLELDGADAAKIAREDWLAVNGAASLIAHERYVRHTNPIQTASTDDDVND